MDKDWMSKNRLSEDYEVGVESFLKFASENAGDLNRIPCPCCKCGNLYKTNVSTIRSHLFCNGMDLTYHTWKFHGESSTVASKVEELDETWHHGQPQESEDPIDMVQDAYETFEENPNQFRKVLEDAERPLFPGNKKFTKLSGIVKLFNLKAKHGWSDTSFTALLRLLNDMLPDGNELPVSIYNAKKSLKTLGMSYEKIHACPNDCILYRKEYENHDACPTCGLSRWKMIGKSQKLNIGVPAKVLWHFPLKPRLLRMYRDEGLASDLTWHANNRSMDGCLRHPVDTPAWKVVDQKWPEFAKEHRNLRLALSADGINPHSNMSSAYSCWPVLLITYNLPPWLCMKRKFIMLSLLISGPKQPGNDIDVYLAPLIDDLKELWEIGIQAYDAFRRETFNLKAVLLWTINDFPAYGNLSGCCVKGYQACPMCADKTHSQMLKHGRKISYRGHRRFLPKYHPYRRQKKAFDGQQEFDTAPEPLTGQQVLERVKNIKCSWGKKDVRKKDDGIKTSKKMKGKRKSREDKGPSREERSLEDITVKDEVRKCWKKKSIFFDLAYWEHLHVRHVLDVMHIEKNVCDSLIGTLLNIPGKTKDGIAARKDLVEMGLRTELAPVADGSRTFLPPACYTLSREEKIKFCKSLHGMKVPTGYSSNVASLVSMKDLKLVGVKSHDCHALIQQLLPVAIRGVLPKHVRYTIIRLCLFFNVICDKVVNVAKLDEIQNDIVTTLCLLEKEFPPSFFDIMIHLVVHLVREVKLCGPVFYRWMYPFERFMKVLKGYVRNRNRPEGCIAESYIVEEAVEFCAKYLANVCTIGIPPSKKQASETRHMTNATHQTISEAEWKQAHLYVMNNDIEMDPFIEYVLTLDDFFHPREHKKLLKQTHPGKAKSLKWLTDTHNKTFIPWIRERLGPPSVDSSSAQEIGTSCLASTKLKWLAHGPSINVLKYQSYLINGVTYHTKDLDNIRVVQNSGVRCVATSMQISTSKDKKPAVGDMTFYGVIREIWELDYHAFHVIVFKCDWAESKKGVKVDDIGFTLVNFNRLGCKLDSFILGNQASQVFYVADPTDPTWSVVLASPNKEFAEFINSSESEDVVLRHQSFTSAFPNLDLNDDEDENALPCIREDCNGIWVNNSSS